MTSGYFMCSHVSLHLSPAVTSQKPNALMQQAQMIPHCVLGYENLYKEACIWRLNVSHFVWVLHEHWLSTSTGCSRSPVGWEFASRRNSLHSENWDTLIRDNCQIFVLDKISVFLILHRLYFVTGFKNVLPNIAFHGWSTMFLMTNSWTFIRAWIFGSIFNQTLTVTQLLRGFDVVR